MTYFTGKNPPLKNWARIGIFNTPEPVSLSVTRVLCDKTKQCTADILISHERAITLVF